MPSTPPSTSGTHGPRASAAAALGSALETVPFLIVAGLVAFAPMGVHMAGLGIGLAFIASLVAQASLIARRGGQGLIIAGPSLGLALILAGALETLRQRGLLTPDDVGPALAVAMALTLGCGVLLAGVTALGIGRLAAIVPYPVLAGLRNGTALLLLLEQGDAVLGLPHGSHFHGALRPGAAVVALVTIVAMLVPLPGMRRIPRVVCGLLAGIAAHHLLALLPDGPTLVGPVMAASVPDPGALVAGWKAVAEVPVLLGPAGAQALAPILASMTLLALLETVAARSALNSGAGLRGSAHPDLAAMAAANLAGAAIGALPAAGSLEETVPTAHAPLRRARQTLLLRMVLLAALGALLLPLLGWVPGAVLAGVIIVAALEVFDIASLRHIAAVAHRGRAHRIEALGNLLIVALVAAVAIAVNLAAAVIVGAVLALVVFVTDMARGPVRRRYRGPVGRSRVRRDDAASELLLREGGTIEVIELQGALFFASADQVAGALEAAVAAGARHVVLDMRHVHRIDLSGAQGLITACERLRRAHHLVSLSGMHRGVPAWDYLHDRGLLAQLPAAHVFATLEDALEAAEDALLEALGRAAVPAGLTPAAALASLAIPQEAVPGLLARMAEQSFPAGAVMLRAGERSRGMFLLLEGRADVVLPPAHPHGDGWRVRVATLGPGTLFGEMALLTGRPRSADMVAHGAVRCLRLDPEGLEALRSEAPEAAWHLLRAVAVQIELNLRLANAAIASYEE